MPEHDEQPDVHLEGRPVGRDRERHGERDRREEQRLARSATRDASARRPLAQLGAAAVDAPLLGEDLGSA